MGVADLEASQIKQSLTGKKNGLYLRYVWDASTMEYKQCMTKATIKVSTAPYNQVQHSYNTFQIFQKCWTHICEKQKSNSCVLTIEVYLNANSPACVTTTAPFIDTMEKLE